MEMALAADTGFTAGMLNGMLAQAFHETAPKEAWFLKSDDAELKPAKERSYNLAVPRVEGGCTPEEAKAIRAQIYPDEARKMASPEQAKLQRAALVAGKCGGDPYVVNGPVHKTYVTSEGERVTAAEAKARVEQMGIDMASFGVMPKVGSIVPLTTTDNTNGAWPPFGLVPVRDPADRADWLPGWYDQKSADELFYDSKERARMLRVIAALTDQCDRRQKQIDDMREAANGLIKERDQALTNCEAYRAEIAKLKQPDFSAAMLESALVALHRSSSTLPGNSRGAKIARAIGNIGVSHEAYGNRRTQFVLD